MEKVNLKKTIIIFVLVVGLFNSSIVYGNDHMEDYQIILMHNEFDVTNLYIDQVSKLKGTKLNDYLDRNHLDMIAITKVNSVKTVTKRCSLRTVNKKIEGNMYTFKWNTVIKCKFSYNPSTYKIGNIYETSINIYDKNICKGFSYANLKGEPSFSKSADNLSILLTAKYTITTRMNSTKVTLGPYIDTTAISA